MKLYNYLKLFGAFTDAYQPIVLDKEPADRAERKMAAEAMDLINAGWSRRMTFLQRRETEGGEAVDYAAEKAAFYPQEVEGDKLAYPLQYVQDYMIRKIAALQNNVSIHDTKDVQELQDVFKEYGVKLVSKFTGLVFDHINWSAKPGQKPKVLLHAKDADGEEVCIRFEAAGELAQKILHAILTLELKQGATFDLSVEAVDPAIAKNQKAGKKVADLGKYVNHNLTLTVDSRTHSGHPQKGQKFIQKPTMEFMETLFRQAQMVTDAI